MTSASMDVPNRRVDLWFAPPQAQRRVTVVFRIILAIPQLIVLIFLSIAAFFVVLVGWFAALITGRYPEFAHSYVSGYVRWEIRVNAYLFLLTDAYPPFTLDDVDYPVRIILPERGRLNRASVLFRFFLAIPVVVFAQIVANGLTAPLILVMWVVVIIKGSMPQSLYTAYSSLVRYQARLHSWYNMLTSEYPWGIMGDFVPTSPGPTSPPPIGAVSGSTGAAAPPPPPPVPGSPPPPPPVPGAQPPAQPFSYPQAGEQVPTPPADAGASPAPPVWPPPQPAPPTGAPGTPGAMPPPSPWERTAIPSSVTSLPSWGILVLQGAARGWIIFAIVWGSIVFIGQNAFRGHSHNNNTTNGLIITVPGNTSTLGHVLVPTPGDH